MGKPDIRLQGLTTLVQAFAAGQPHLVLYLTDIGVFPAAGVLYLRLAQSSGPVRLRQYLLATLPELPGPVCIYYGTEIGLSQPASKAAGGFGGAHVVRGAMVWDPAGWDQSLLTFFRDLISLRRQNAPCVAATAPCANSTASWQLLV